MSRKNNDCSENEKETCGCCEHIEKTNYCNQKQMFIRNPKKEVECFYFERSFSKNCSKKEI